MKTLFSLFAVFLLSLQPLLSAPRTPTSEFTSTDLKKGKVYEGPSDAGHLFAGQGPYRVILRTGEERSWIDLLHGNKEILLAQPIFSECPGQRPWKANTVVQWRGYRSGNQFIPFGIIFRMYSENPNGKKPFDTLVVVKLDGANTRVVGHVPGSAGNLAAEALADRLCQQ
jgi:hypothetical protein